MNPKNFSFKTVLLVAVIFGVVACNTTQPTSTPTTQPEPSIAGRYRMRPPGYEEDHEQTIKADYYLVLNKDQTAQLEEQPIDGADMMGRTYR